jgi:hypothetical protein
LIRARGRVRSRHHAAAIERERVEVASNGVAVRVAGRAEFAPRAQIDRGVVSILTAFERHRETTATSRDATRFDVVPSRSRDGRSSGQLGDWGDWAKPHD